MNKVIHMTYTSSLSSICERNASFDSGVLRIAYAGKNRNGSYISKEVFEKCASTMYNCPLVCNYDRETDSIGGHDMELVADDNGNLRFVNKTIPVGVIPESSNYFWDKIEDKDGVEREYLCADVLIWKRQEAYRKIRQDGVVAHSMELTVKSGGTENGVYVIDDFEFTAFCLLGDDHEPCFEDSALGMFSYSEAKKQMSQMMEDMMQELRSDYSFIKPESGIDNKNTITEGGKVLDEKIALVAEYGYEVESLGFSIEEISAEELKEKFEAMKTTEAAPEEAPEEHFELNSQLCEEIRCAVETEMVERSWGKMPRYSVVDFDADSMMVYCFDAEDHWRLYGFAFSMNGDNVVVDFESKKRMKFAIVDFDEGEQSMPFDSIFEQVSESYTANDAQWSEKYQSASDTIESMNDELSSLRQFKTDTENAVKAAAREEIFARFDDLVGVEEFEALCACCEDLELDALEEKCYAIRGKNGAKAKFSKSEKTPKLKVEHIDPANMEYGGLFEKYRPRV